MFVLSRKCQWATLLFPDTQHFTKGPTKTMSVVIAFDTSEEQSPFDALRQVRPDGSEFWSARGLMPLLGYAKWQRFEDSVGRAQVSAGNQGFDVAREFVQVAQVTEAGNLGDTLRKDYELSRFACYLVAMNGDPRKQQVSAAQAYFAIRTREAETASQRELTPTELALMVIESEKQKVAAQRQLAVLVPKAERFDRWQDSGNTMYVEEWSKALGMTRDAGFEHLRALGVLSRRKRTDGIAGYVNVPNGKYVSLFEMKNEFVESINMWVLVPRMTPRGAILLAELLVRHGRLSPESLGYAPLPALPGEIE